MERTLDFINNKIIELIFKLNIPFSIIIMIMIIMIMIGLMCTRIPPSPNNVKKVIPDFPDTFIVLFNKWKTYILFWDWSW